MQNHNRKHPAHPAPVERFNESIILHVTVCLKDRQHLLNHPIAHAVLRAVWRLSGKWTVGEYVIMPDHVHLFCTPAVRPSIPVKTWVKFWKREVGIAYPELKHIWQRDCWDTQMRSREMYDEKLSYVRQNPVRAGLVEEAEEWKYAGRIKVLRW